MYIKKFIYVLLTCVICTILFFANKEDHPPVQREIVGKIIAPKVTYDPIVKCKMDKHCRKMAEAVVYEARGESFKGQLAVAHVILNRTRAPQWANDIVGVITQPHQFSYLKDKAFQKPPRQEDWNMAYRVAYKTIKGKVTSPVGDSTHYHTHKVKPEWSKKLQKVAVIGNHIFYK